ncbi:MAG: serine/threonine-protein kinase [Planctomycetota bacterium]
MNEEFNLPFLAMERLHGESLLKLLESDFPISDQQAFRIASQVAAGLAMAHSQNIVHRDVKPANIFLELPAGQIKLLDFGLARSLFAKDNNAVLLGTPGYMAPEQARDEPADHRSDIYAVGVLLYRLLAGKLPLGNHDSATLLAKLLTEDAPSLQQARPDLPGNVTALVGCCLSRQPSGRPQEMNELKEQLEALCDRHPDGSRIAVPQEESDQARWLTSFMSLALAAVLAVVAIYGISFFGPWQNDESQQTSASREPDPFAQIGSSAPSESAPRRPTTRPQTNVPESLSRGIRIRPGDGRGADTFVSQRNDDDVGALATMLVSNQKETRSAAYIRFDLAEVIAKRNQIVDVHLLITLVKDSADENREQQVWSCEYLRDEAPDPLWQATGPERIVFGDTPAKVPAVDLRPAGTIRGSLSKWFEDDKIMLLSLTNRSLAEAIRDDTDGLLTLVIRSRERENPDAKFVSSEGPDGFSPCLVVRLADDEKRKSKKAESE